MLDIEKAEGKERIESGRENFRELRDRHFTAKKQTHPRERKSKQELTKTCIDALNYPYLMCNAVIRCYCMCNAVIRGLNTFIIFHFDAVNQMVKLMYIYHIDTSLIKRLNIMS